ncbi:MAG: tetratricopeptide repeat protein [Pelagibacterales bacterium]|nr:tetratricopeptide repeat protein [Pelagibacterales bacterium]
MATFKKRGYKKSLKTQNNPDFNKNSQTAEVFEKLDSGASASEKWIAKHQNKIISALILIAFLVLAFISYDRYIKQPREKLAMTEMNQAQFFFDQAIVAGDYSDSLFNLAINGGEGKYGFLDITKEYKNTKAANIANYSIGMSYLNLKDYENAIIYLEKFESDDIFLNSIALGSIGDCFSELSQPNEAFEYYEKAFNSSENSYTSPKFLYKAAVVGSQIGKNRLAIKYLKRIKDEFPDSHESTFVDVQLGRLENIGN